MEGKSGEGRGGVAAGSLDARSREEMTLRNSGYDIEISLHIVLWRSLAMVLEAVWANDYMSDINKGSRASSGCESKFNYVQKYHGISVLSYDWQSQAPDIFPIKPEQPASYPLDAT